MAGKDDASSKANGVSKSEEKGKGKVEDLKDQKNDAEKKDTEGKPADGKLLPPGAYLPVRMG